MLFRSLAVMGGVLYVADTGNHLLRGVNLDTWEVTTLAGTGQLGRGQGSANPREPLSVPLRSPWGLLAMGEQLLVAMAGTHQVWVYDPSLPAIAPWAGSGVEDHIDGPLKEMTDAVLPDEFPLSMFYEALTRRIGDVVASTSGITGRTEAATSGAAG